MVTVTGALRVGAVASRTVELANPTYAVASMVRARLESVGIDVRGGVSTGTASKHARVVVAKRTPLVDILLRQPLIEQVRRRVTNQIPSDSKYEQSDQHGHQRVLETQSQASDAQAQRDDADVLDAVIREQPLEIMLGQRPEHSEDSRGDPDQDEEDAPPGGKRG